MAQIDNRGVKVPDDNYVVQSAGNNQHKNDYYKAEGGKLVVTTDRPAEGMSLSDAQALAYAASLQGHNPEIKNLNSK